MRKYLYILFICLCLFPLNVFASVRATNLQDTLTEENIELSTDNYEENENQVTVYLFRGSGCSHCQELLEYLNSITEEYGDKFKLRSYEVWSNTDNADLKEKIVKYMDLEAEGVPLLIIGENTFYGFSDDNKEDIITAILNEYETDKDERYDIIKKYNENKEENKNSALYILIPAFTIIIIYFIIKSVKKDMEEL